MYHAHPLILLPQLLTDSRGTIRRAIIDHDDLEISSRLLQYAGNALFKI
jgi:hypothetical protein